jgi:hypothetical protein
MCKYLLLLFFLLRQSCVTTPCPHLAAAADTKSAVYTEVEVEVELLFKSKTPPS